MEYCYFLPDSAYFHAPLPPADAIFLSAADLNFEQLPNRYWVKFSIRNREDRQVSIQLFLGLSEKLDFFVPTASGYEKYPIGTFEPRKVARKISGPGKTFLAQAVVALGPGETKTCYAFFHHLSTGAQASRDSKISPPPDRPGHLGGENCRRRQYGTSFSGVSPS